MKNRLRESVFRYGYLLIAAAWLFTLSFIVSNYFSYTSSPGGLSSSLQQYIQKNENAFSGLLHDSALLNRLYRQQPSEIELEKLTELPFGVFLYDITSETQQQLIFWNTQRSVPEAEMLDRPDGVYVVELANGTYVLIRSRLSSTNGTKRIAIGLLPVQWKYFIQNQYLQNGFAHQPNSKSQYAITQEETSYPIYSSGKKVLFYLEEAPVGRAYSNDWLTLFLRLAGSVLILFFFHLIALQVSRFSGPWKAIGLLTGVVILLRLISYLLPVPVNFRQFELFDPAVYGANSVARSLGDLLINALLFLWLLFFSRSVLSDEDLHPAIEKEKKKWIYRAGSVLLMILLTVACGSLIRSLVADSNISFDVTNFFGLSWFTAFGFIVICTTSISYFMIMQVLISFFLHVTNDISRLYRLLILLVAILLYLTIRIGNSSIGFEMLLLIWMLGLIYLIIRWQLLPKGAAISSASPLFWIFFFSTSVTALVIMENKDHELSLRMRTAEKLAIQADPSSERLFNIAILSISDQFLEDNFDRFRDQNTNTILKDSLVSANFGPFFNKYETALFTFDAKEYPLSASESLNYDTLNAFFTIQGKPTSINGLKYFETSFDQYSYIYHKEVRDRLTDSLEGHFFMLSTPRKYKSDALFPELFRQPDDFSFERSSNYAYAVYNNKDLVKHINDYDFPISIEPESLSKEVFHTRNRNGYSELWYKAAHSRTVVIAKKSNLFLEAITLFAYFFGVFLFTAGLFQFLALLIKTRFNRSRFRNEWRFSIRNQIYGTILFIGIFSFIVIGATTILFFIRRYDNNNRDRLVRTINVMSDELKNHIVSHGAGNDVLPDYDSASNHTLYQDIIEVSERYNADVNLYKPDGSLQISSSPLVYNKGVLSRKMDPVAFFQLNRMKRIQWIQEEKYGKLEYLSVYLPVRNEKGDPYAYLNIPYFASQSDLKQEISTFLVTLINLNAFIFLLAGIIALFIANRITGSLRLIGDLMKQVNLGKHNAEIDWKSNDEVGGLVKEYNTMVKKLEESAMALAKSEREGAWREMARQVAHEIKNPLTPMKLSIQYLQKAMDQNSDNVKELTAKVAGTLVEQIEHLSKIAADFSQFANIGNPRMEDFDLQEVMASVIALHSAQDECKIFWNQLPEPQIVRADKTHMNRLFTNLIRNAMEAIPADRRGIILVTEEQLDKELIIRIGDNGTGIPVEKQDKIFTPNFTTKSSGTGLGLAMCKGIVEQAGGSIHFETNVGQGTTFIIRLPLAR